MKSSLPKSSSVGHKDGDHIRHFATPLQDVNDAAFRIGHTYPGGVPALAQRMGDNPNTLNHKLNPNNESHRLSVGDAVRLQIAANRFDVLYAMASSLNHVCLPLPEVESRDDVAAQLMRIGAEIGDVFRVAGDAIRDDKITPNERRKVATEVAEVMAALGALLQVL